MTTQNMNVSKDFQSLDWFKTNISGC